MTKWLHTLGTIAAVAIAIISPGLQQYIGAHAQASSILIGLYAILGHILPSPTGAGTPPSGNAGGLGIGS